VVVIAKVRLNLVPRVGNRKSVHRPGDVDYDDADLLPFADFPVAHRRIGSDTGAKKRRGAGGRDAGR